MNHEPSLSDEPQGRTPLEDQLRRLRPVPLRVSAEDLLRAAADPGEAGREAAGAAIPVHAPAAPAQWAALAVACLGGVAIGASLAVLLSPGFRPGRLDAAAAPSGPADGGVESRLPLDTASPNTAPPNTASPPVERREPSPHWSPSDWRVAGQLGELRDSRGASAPLFATSHVWPQRQRPDRRPATGWVSRSESLPDGPRGPVSRPIRSSDSDLLLQELFRL